MKYIIICIFYVCFFSSVQAAGLQDSDSGTFVFLDKEKNPTDTYYRLSKSAGKWVLEGKNSKKPEWENITSHECCKLHDSKLEDIRKYFTSDWFEKFDITCVENKGNAICHLTLKNNPQKGIYAVVMLEDKSYLSMRLARVE